MNLEGYKTVIFFTLALLVAVANLFGFGGFQMTAEQLEITNIVIAVVGLVLRYYTKSEIFKPSK